MNPLCLALLASMVACPIAPDGSAQASPARQSLTEGERIDFAARETRNPEALKFEAGVHNLQCLGTDTVITMMVLFIGLVTLLVVVLVHALA